MKKYTRHLILSTRKFCKSVWKFRWSHWRKRLCDGMATECLKNYPMINVRTESVEEFAWAVTWILEIFRVMDRKCMVLSAHQNSPDKARYVIARSGEYLHVTGFILPGITHCHVFLILYFSFSAFCFDSVRRHLNHRITLSLLSLDSLLQPHIQILINLLPVCLI